MEHTMAGATTTLVKPSPVSDFAAHQGTTEPRWLRYLLTAIALSFLTLFIVLPAANVFSQALAKGWQAYVNVLVPQKPADMSKLSFSEKRMVNKAVAQSEKNWTSIKMTVSVVLLALPLNVIFGIAAAWAIARFKFPGRSLLISLIDLPFSVSPVVAGLIFVLLFGRQSPWGDWAGNFTYPSPFSIFWRGFTESWFPFGFGTWYTGVIFTPLSIVLATIFVTFPFVPRSLIPLMQAQGTDEELASLSLGATGWQTFFRVTLPNIKWGLIYGITLCAARALGEFGAVSVVSGHLDPNDTMPLRIEKLWQEYDNQAAFTMASLLTTLAVLTLIIKTYVEIRTANQLKAGAESKSL